MGLILLILNLKLIQKQFLAAFNLTFDLNPKYFIVKFRYISVLEKTNSAGTIEAENEFRDEIK